jgi:hypothetical protein
VFWLEMCMCDKTVGVKVGEKVYNCIHWTISMLQLFFKHMYIVYMCMMKMNDFVTL